LARRSYEEKRSVRRFEVRRLNFWGLGTFSGPEIEIDFQSGPLLVDGEVIGSGSLSSNGAGKSTLLNAIMLGMFGELPSGAVRGDGIISQNVRSGDDPSFSCLEMYDRVSDKFLYTEWSKLPGKGAEYRVSDDRNVLGVFGPGDDRHHSFLKSNFGILPESFCEINYYAQGSLSKITDGTDLDRKRSLIVVLGLSGCDEYLNEVKGLENQTKQAVSRNSSQISFLEDRMHSLKGVKGDLKNVEVDIANLETDQASIESAYRMVMSAIDRMSKSENLIREIEHLKGQIEDMKDEREETLKSFGQRYEEYERSKEDLNRKIVQVEPLREGIAEKDSEIDSLKKEVKRLEDIGSVDINIEPIVKEIAFLESIIESSMDVLHKLRMSKKRCYVCGKRITRSQRRQMAQEARANILVSRFKIGVLVKRQGKILGDADTNKRREEALSHARQKLSGLVSGLESSKALYEEFVKAEKDLELLNARLETHKASRDLTLKNIDKDIEDAKKDMKDYEARILKEFGKEGVAKLEGARKRLSELEKERSSVGERLAVLRERASNISEKVSSLSEMKLNVRGLSVKQGRLNKLETALSFWSRGFSPSGIPTMVIEGAIPRLNESLSALCESLIPNRNLAFSSGRKLLDGRTSDEILLSVMSENGEEIPLSLCSGGERKRIRMVVRLALQEVVNTPFDFFMFDEVTHELDTRGKTTLVQQITSTLDGSVVLFTSNDQSIQDMFTQRVTVVKENHVSRIEV
jgi:DNA repair exonuclease SbcCD ATPase subunit